MPAVRTIACHECFEEIDSNAASCPFCETSLRPKPRIKVEAEARSDHSRGGAGLALSSISLALVSAGPVLGVIAGGLVILILIFDPDYSSNSEVQRKVDRLFPFSLIATLIGLVALGASVIYLLTSCPLGKLG